MMLDAIDWILRQCVEAAIVCGLFCGADPRPDVRIEGVWYNERGHVGLEWSES